MFTPVHAFYSTYFMGVVSDKRGRFFTLTTHVENVTDYVRNAYVPTASMVYIPTASMVYVPTVSCFTFPPHIILRFLWIVLSKLPGQTISNYSIYTTF